ncbi:MAG: GNAT family N-acetyltransferase [Thermoplasmatota archaeon]
MDIKGSKPVEVRRTSGEDIPKLAAYKVDQLNEIYEHPDDDEARDLKDRIRKFLSKHLDEGDMFCYIAISSGKIVGSACLMIRDSQPVYDLFDRGKLGYVMNIHTSEEYRGLGITNQLVQRIIDSAREAGIEYIHVHCSEDMTRFYSKLGFSEVTAREMKLVLN